MPPNPVLVFLAHFGAASKLYLKIAESEHLPGMLFLLA